MAQDTKIGLLVGIGFIVCFAMVLSHRGRVEGMSAAAAYQALSRSDTGPPFQATSVGQGAMRWPGSAASRSEMESRLSADAVGDVSIGQRLGIREATSTRESLDGLSVPGHATTESSAKIPTFGGETTGSDKESMDGAVATQASASRSANALTWESIFGPSSGTEQAGGAAVKQETAPSSAPNQSTTAMTSPRTAGGDVERVPQESTARHAVKYSVQSNDTLWAIVHKVYGRSSRELVDALFEANRSRISSVDKVLPGTQLICPVLKGVAPIEVVDKSLKKKVNQREAERPAKSRGGSNEFYDVKKGDHYAAIAERVLGDKTRWRELYELNRDIFPDPGKIQHGVRIRLPL